jgi:hypothetical protein
MAEVKQFADWMAERGMSLARLVEVSMLDKRVVEAIAYGRYTPSPQQRQGLAAALGVSTDQILWGHLTAVDHLYGHGPQFGRSP